MSAHRRSRFFLLLFIVLLLFSLSACASIVRGPGKKVLYEEVSFNASDNVSLVASYYPSAADKGLILLHMLAKSRHSFDDYAPDLIDRYKVVSVDLRGHGQSDEQLDYVDLTESDFRDMLLDVEAAALFLQSVGVNPSDISLVGASTGANLAVLYAEKHPVDKLVLLSPGMRLRGVDISRVSLNRPVFIQVAHYDAYASISVDELQVVWPQARVMRYDTSAHGTDMLKYDLSAKEDFFFYLL